MSHGGMQGVYKHVAKTTQCEMTFAVFMPPSTPPLLQFYGIYPDLHVTTQMLWRKVDIGASQQSLELPLYARTLALAERVSLTKKTIGNLVQVLDFT